MTISGLHNLYIQALNLYTSTPTQICGLCILTLNVKVNEKCLLITSNKSYSLKPFCKRKGSAANYLFDLGQVTTPYLVISPILHFIILNAESVGI